jgi:tetratricopeptide (TPR) repeat protein
MKKKFLIILLILSCAAFMGLKIKLDNIPRKTVPGSSFIYIPSGKFLKYATFGYSSLMADLIYVWSIQYFSDQKIPNRFNYLDHVFSIIAELDPRYFDPYQIGAIFAVYDAGDFDTCEKILNRGLEKNPGEWIFPFQAGHYAQMLLKDYKIAQKYFKKTMEIEGAPAMAKRLYANAAFEQTDYKTAMRNWVEVYKMAEAEGDERVRKIAANHIYRTQASIDIESINEGLNKYKENFGHYPEELSKLVTSGFLAEIPEDLDGNEYKYDPETGEVKSELWWKR